MPSLRRSLIGYFLGLLALALVGVGLLLDRFAVVALEARENAEHKRIHQEFETRGAEAQAKFDDELLFQARSLGREIRQKYLFLQEQASDENQKRFTATMAAYTLGDLGSPLGSTVNGAMFFERTNQPNATWFRSPARNARYALYWAFISNTQTDLRISQSFAEEGEHPQYYQIHIPRLRRDIRSPEQSFSLPVDVEGEIDPDAAPQKFGDVTVAGVGEFRRVVYRTNLLFPARGQAPSSQPNPNPRPRGDGRPPAPTPTQPGQRPAPGAAPNPNQDSFLPPVFVQCARPKGELNDILAPLAQSRDEQLTRVARETAAELKNLRFNVGGIAAATFLALAVGGWLLVGLGLSPLRKLTEAVSRVNEREFRLPVEKRELTRELVPIHDRLTHSLDSLKAAFEREKEAIADISHELRTPVAGLLATLDVSLRKPRSAEQYKTTLEECRAITKQLSHLVERVMTLAYIDAGHAPAAISETDASALAAGCAAVVRPLAESHGLTLTSDSSLPVELKTDPDKLREVMMNLLHNAVEYNRPGGNVNLTVERSGPGVQVVVRDTGIGMPPDVQGKIFERFYRADPSRTTTGVHAGLGLAIVKEYVRSLGGTIEVESLVGQGTTFRVMLPLEHHLTA